LVDAGTEHVLFSLHIVVNPLGRFAANTSLATAIAPNANRTRPYVIALSLQIELVIQATFGIPSIGMRRDAKDAIPTILTPVSL
jgi:hypothetical protein